MVKKRILLIVLGIWLTLAVFSVSYNILYTISEIRNWYFLTDSQKRHKIFGELYELVVFIDKNTSPKASILLVTEDGFPFYLARYYLYPKKLVWVTKPEAMPLQRTVAYDYVASYPLPLSKKEYRLVSVMKHKNSTPTAFLYRKK